MCVRFMAMLLLLVTLPAFALEKPEDIRACVLKNFADSSSSHTFSLTTIGADGAQRALHASAYWKRDSDGKAQVTLTVDSPDDLRGAAYLILERDSRDDLFMYLPAVGRTKRILGNQTSSPLWGTDFSYEDIKHVQGIFGSGKLKRGADADLDGKKVYVLNFEPDKLEESAYRKLVSYVDPATCVTLQTDFYEDGDTPRKRLSANPQKVAQEGPRWIAKFYEIKDMRDNTRSELVIEKLVFDTDLPQRLFNPKTFQLGR